MALKRDPGAWYGDTASNVSHGPKAAGIHVPPVFLPLAPSSVNCEREDMAGEKVHVVAKSLIRGVTLPIDDLCIVMPLSLHLLSSDNNWNMVETLD